MEGPAELCLSGRGSSIKWEKECILKILPFGLDKEYPEQQWLVQADSSTLLCLQHGEPFSVLTIDCGRDHGDASCQCLLVYKPVRTGKAAMQTWNCQLPCLCQVEQLGFPTGPEGDRQRPQQTHSCATHSAPQAPPISSGAPLPAVAQYFFKKINKPQLDWVEFTEQDPVLDSTKGVRTTTGYIPGSLEQPFLV